MDLYWATAGGQNLAELLARLGDRVVAVHTRMAHAPRDQAQQLPDDQGSAGKGDVPLAAALAAGTAIEYAVVEFDKYAGDIFEGIEGSVRVPLSSIIA